MKGNLIKEVWPSIVNGRNLQSDPSLEGCRMSLLCVCHDAPRNGTVISDQFNIPSGPVLGVHLTPPPEETPPVEGVACEPERPTDLGNAERLVRHHGQDIRYVGPWKKWLAWDGIRWAIDRAAVERRAKDTVRQIYQEAASLHDKTERAEAAKWATISESYSRLEAMVKLAASEKGIEVLPQALDRDPWLLNCLNDTLDLRTGELHVH